MNARTVLIKVDGVMALTGQDSDTVFARADGGSLLGQAYQWVFNLAADVDGQQRDLRFWVREIIAPETTAKLSLDQVLLSIAPRSKARMHAGEICFQFQIRRQSLARLREELGGELGAGGSFFETVDVRAFLAERWLGAKGKVEGRRMNDERRTR